MDEREIQNIIQSQAEELRRIKDDRRSLEARMRLFISNLPLGLIMVNKTQGVEAANGRAVESFQYTAEEFLEVGVQALFPELDSFEATGKATRMMCRKKNGDTFVAEVFVNTFVLEGQEVLVITFQDITERFQLEQLKRDLIGMVSHDLRNPLASVLLTLEMVEEEKFGELSERGHRSVGRAVSVVEYLISLVVNILDSERIDQGEIELEYADTSVAAIVQKAIDTIPKELGSVDIETDFTNDGITADRDRIVQILINLITNAIKFSPQGAKVRIKAGLEGVNVKFQVADDGPGIPKDMQSIVFERYRQLEQTSAIKRKGFGLGLAICKALVEAHKGKIWVESDGKKGSKFCFTIPMSPDA